MTKQQQFVQRMWRNDVLLNKLKEIAQSPEEVELIEVAQRKIRAACASRRITPAQRLDLMQWLESHQKVLMQMYKVRRQRLWDP